MDISFAILLIIAASVAHNQADEITRLADNNRTEGGNVSLELQGTNSSMMGSIVLEDRPTARQPRFLDLLFGFLFPKNKQQGSTPWNFHPNLQRPDTLGFGQQGGSNPQQGSNSNSVSSWNFFGSKNPPLASNNEVLSMRFPGNGGQQTTFKFGKEEEKPNDPWKNFASFLGQQNTKSPLNNVNLKQDDSGPKKVPQQPFEFVNTNTKRPKIEP